jgi:hypothetical protein
MSIAVAMPVGTARQTPKFWRIRHRRPAEEYVAATFNTGEPFLIALVFMIGIGINHATATGTQGAWFAELFSSNTRTSGTSIGYQVAASIAGFAPFLAVMPANSCGWIGPAMFDVFVGFVGRASVLVTAETWGAGQRAEVDALITGTRPADVGAR